jgi:anaerobic selenocysteine-containing dehydrogenase
MESRFVPSTCPHDCPSACPLEVERLDAHTVGRVRGAPGHPYTEGIICAKVARYAERTHHPDRLTRPLVRRGPKGSGDFVPAPWDEALDRVAEAFQAASHRHGLEAVWPYWYAGTMGQVQRDGIHRLAHVLRYSREKPTICASIAGAGWMAGVGAKRGADARTIAEADLIVVWGCNAVHTQVQVMTKVAVARKARGAKLVVIDPYRNPTAAQADLHLMLRPGTDGALACAVMHVLFKEGFADRDYLARYTDCPERLERHLQSRTPAWAAAITGLTEEDIVAFARLYGGTPRSFIRFGYGMTRQRNGAANLHAASCLPAVTGAWRHRGGGALMSSSGVFALDKTLIEGLDVRDPATRLLDQSRIGPILLGEQDALGGGPPVAAMLVQNTNPAAVAPEGDKVRRGLSRDDLFLCVHEQFLTETARFADVVLPATTFLEHDDLYTAYGHTFLQATRAVIEPVGEARSNHDVLCALATRLGADHPGFRLTAWDLIDATLKTSGLPGADELHAMRWLDCQVPFERANFIDGFGHADGRFRFAADWKALGPDADGLPELPDHAPLIDEATPEHPFRLVTAPSRNFLNSTFSETPGSRQREGRPTVQVHPDDCAALGLTEGATVRVGNRRGTVVVHVRPFDGLPRGVVVVEGVWPNGAFIEGRGINFLTGADPVPPAGGAAFHDTAVWLKAE